MPNFNNKKLILVFGCLTIFFPGAIVFGFPGVMAAEWQSMFNVNKEQIGQIMFFMLSGTGFSMYLAGRLQTKMPGRVLVFTGNIGCALGMILVGHASSMTDVYIWAFLEGFFTGFVYIPSLTIYQRMFPENKGVIIGIINLTFGGAAAVMSPLFTYLLISKGYLYTSYFCAFAALMAGLLAAPLVKLPGYKRDKAKKAESTFSFVNIIRTPSFWYLWLVWALSGAAGISLIVLASSFGMSLGYGLAQYVYILAFFNILNGIGRLLCGRLADNFSKQKIMMTINLLAAAAYLLMPHFSSIGMACFFACFIGLAFGGLFTVSAQLVTEVFGLENFGKVFGLIFTAYGFFSGMLGPWLSGIILDATQSNFKIVFSMFALFYFISSVLILRVRKNKTSSSRILSKDFRNAKTSLENI